MGRVGETAGMTKVTLASRPEGLGSSVQLKCLFWPERGRSSSIVIGKQIYHWGKGRLRSLLCAIYGLPTEVTRNPTILHSLLPSDSRLSTHHPPTDVLNHWVVHSFTHQHSSRSGYCTKRTKLPCAPGGKRQIINNEHDVIH